ncbi:MAG: ferritin [Candidatus Cloacimonetes bacterium]|nr:ferritin [Candidatus Cloacimonadota bacterium]
MFSEKLEKELNLQINKEFYAQYLYLSMSAYAESIGLDGIAHWFRAQSEEEYTHAMKIFDFVNEKGGRVILEPIKKPKHDFKSVKQLFELALEHEKFVTDSINKLLELAMKEKEHSTVSFLKWFVDEQVEEEDSVNNILDKFQYIKDSGMGLIHLNNALGNRK